jgi:hypothetical protein
MGCQEIPQLIFRVPAVIGGWIMMLLVGIVSIIGVSFVGLTLDLGETFGSIFRPSSDIVYLNRLRSAADIIIHFYQNTFNPRTANGEALLRASPVV